MSMFLFRFSFPFLSRNANGDCALHIAASRGDTDIMRILADNSCDVNAIGSNKESALIKVARTGIDVAVEQVMVMQGVDVNIKDAHGSTFLHYLLHPLAHSSIHSLRSTFKSTLDRIEFCLSQGWLRAESLNSRDRDLGATPLHYLAMMTSSDDGELMFEDDDDSRRKSESDAQRKADGIRAYYDKICRIAERMTKIDGVDANLVMVRGSRLSNHNPDFQSVYERYSNMRAHEIAEKNGHKEMVAAFLRKV